MKIHSPTSHTPGGLLVLGLSAYAVASPSSLDTLRQNSLARSLPGSVAAAPAETVGYQPSPATASENSDSSASPNTSTTEDTGDNSEDYESKQQKGTTENSGDFDAYVQLESTIHQSHDKESLTCFS